MAAQAPSIRQRRGMVILAHIREQHRLSLGSYGRPRMTEELNELGLRVGQRRAGRLMRQNRIRIIRSRKVKRTTDSDHSFIAIAAPVIWWVDRVLTLGLRLSVAPEVERRTE